MPANPDASPIDAPSPIDATFDAGNWIDPLDHGFGVDGVALTLDGLPSRVAIDALGRIVIVGVRHGATPDLVGPSVTRNAGMRGQLLKTYGGNQKTEDAVMRALRWLKKNQQADGSVIVPEALVPWMGGVTRLDKA